MGRRCCHVYAVYTRKRDVTRRLESILAREGIRRAELEAAIREHGFKDVGDCRAAILEIDGSISVVGMDDPVHALRLPPLHHHHRKGGRRGFKPGQ